eukprot:scaffold886_cov174-Ochromonas_danica.AAC.2
MQKGFDPLHFADTPERYFCYREAELKHGRVAMLAAFGWPVSEASHYALARSLGLPGDLLEATTLGKAPSVLNGGLDNAFVLAGLGVFFLVGAVLEVVTYTTLPARLTSPSPD